MQIICWHGVSRHEGEGRTGWRMDWKGAILDGLIRAGATIPKGADRDTDKDDAVFSFPEYEDEFAKTDLGAAEWAEAFARLGLSLAWHSLPNLSPGGRGWFEGIGRVWNSVTEAVYETYRWRAGMVAIWASREKLRKTLRSKVIASINAAPPDSMIFAHSLGSLIVYDALSHQDRAGIDPKKLKTLRFVSFGSQIGNPGVRQIFGGRIIAPPIAQWYNLFNPEDAVLTRSVRLSDPRFTQVSVLFDQNGPGDHGPVAEFSRGRFVDYGYLDHPENDVRLYPALAAQTSPTAPPSATRKLASFMPILRSDAARRQNHRALMIGINQYANPSSNLAGCVNDAYLMSETFQRLGMPAGQIRLLLDHRATAQAIRERLEWLLDDVREGDFRVLHYSGHGAQIPSYGGSGEADQLDECIAPHDFDFTPQTAILDKYILSLYADLPYGAHFIAVMDCCHSGGLHRNSAIRARGLSLPPDIRHRMINWGAEEGWTQKSSLGARKQIFYATDLRSGGNSIPAGKSNEAKFKKYARQYGHPGPYLPIILQACGESELAEEHIEGNESYGAFTWVLNRLLKKWESAGTDESYVQLIDQAKQELRRMGYGQEPQCYGPTERKRSAGLRKDLATKTYAQ